MRPRGLLICAGIGVCLGFTMILTRTGPGIRPRPPASTSSYRNTQRATIVKDLAAALEQYGKDHGPLPVVLTEADTHICTSSGTGCTSKHLIDLSFLITGGQYLPGIPQDPLGGTQLWDSGLTIAKLGDGSLRITAPRAELGKTIEASAHPSH